MGQPVNPSARDAVLAALVALLKTHPEAAMITFTSARVSATFQLPREAPAGAGGAGVAAGDTQCAEDILYVLGELGGRVTMPAGLTALGERGLIHGESTIKATLARLVHDGRITNRSDLKPRGYALAGPPDPG
jgi:hypothetical protein